MTALQRVQDLARMSTDVREQYHLFFRSALNFCRLGGNQVTVEEYVNGDAHMSKSLRLALGVFLEARQRLRAVSGLPGIENITPFDVQRMCD